MRTRLLVVATCFAALFGAVGLRLVDLGLPRAPDVATPYTPAAAVELARADLLDRHGRLLATTTVAPLLVADPREVRDAAAEARAIAAALGETDPARLERLLASDRHHVVLSREIGPRQAEAVRRLGLPAVGFEYHPVRLYPNGTLAAHTLGYVDVDNKGLSGAELAFEDRLVGPDRAPVRLALDLGVQAVVEQELAAAMQRHRAKAAAALVLDARTGELLAMASLPSFDPHHPMTATDEARKDRILTQTFELGSVFKLLTVAAGLQSGAIQLGDRLDATHPLRIGRSTISDYRPRNRVLTVSEGLVHSSNIANARIGLKIGPERYRQFLHELGMDAPIALEGGVTARPQLPPRWSDIAVATVAFGHGLAVTPLHYASAVAALLTDGRTVQPTLLADNVPTSAGNPVIDRRVALTMRGLAWNTLTAGRSNGLVDGYLIGGKTGTAQKVGANGRYQSGVVRSSFVAAFPIQDPDYVVFTMIDEPHAAAGQPSDRITGGWTSAPTVSRIVTRIGPLLGVEPTPAEVAAQLREWSGQTPPASVEGGAGAARPSRG